MSLAKALSRARKTGRCAFVPFLTAGDPDLKSTRLRVRALAACGADIIELGVPFSDPVADGPVIQDAAARALKAKTTLKKILALVASMRGEGFSTPIVLFTYLNPALQLGLSRFAKQCAKAGVEGVLAVDVAAEDSGELSRALKAAGVELVLLASPTTTDERLKFIGRASGSIVYYVSREGVTGARAGNQEGIAQRLARVRGLVKKPLIVGFGVARAEQARALSADSDGVVVGSALVAAAVGGGTKAMTALARRLVAGLKLSKGKG